VEKRFKRAPVILLAAAVVIAGTAIAFQFRRLDEPEVSSASTVPAKSLIESPSAKHESANSTHASPTFAGRVEATNENQLTPSMASALAELDRKVFPSQTAAQGPNSPQNQANLLVPQAHQSTSSAKPLVALESEEKIHRIADGDTLSKLAERYLGRADRSPELFEYNRDVLRTPDVLPIGADLRIPPMIPVQAVDPTTHSNDAASALQTQLVPVNPSPVAQPPIASTAAPPANVAAAKSQKPHTYEVKAGESLVDIARKLYGDGRRHEQLFEANRNVLKNPAALKPGMVLVVP
jgi:nucleoid-associated protein YgaU